MQWLLLGYHKMRPKWDAFGYAFSNRLHTLILDADCYVTDTPFCVIWTNGS